MINPGVSCGTCAECARGEESLCPAFQVLGEHRSGTLAELVVVPESNLGARAGRDAVAPGRRVLPRDAHRVAHAGDPRAGRAGETVLVWGVGGGVALAAVQVAVHAGARVIATSSSAEKLEVARGYGAEGAGEPRHGRRRRTGARAHRQSRRRRHHRQRGGADLAAIHPAAPSGRAAGDLRRDRRTRMSRSTCAGSSGISGRCWAPRSEATRSIGRSCGLLGRDCSGRTWTRWCRSIGRWRHSSGLPAVNRRASWSSILAVERERPEAR